MELNDRRVLVVGLARTGEAVVRFLVAKGARVTVTDMKTPGELSASVARLRGLSVGFELGYHDTASFRDADLVVVSPGVPMDIMPLQISRNAGKPVIAEIELASAFIEAPMLAITGTNGKTTTTTLAGEIMHACGFATYVGGNIGQPLIDALASPAPYDRMVVELSSFQLEGIARFHPRVAVLLNISEDHLDRYASYEEYIAAKARIFTNMGPDDYAVLNMDDPIVADLARGLSCRIVPMSQRRELVEGICLLGDELVYRWAGREERFPTAPYLIKGVHNTENIMAALAGTLLLGADPALAQKAVAEFRGLPHRMELVRTLNGVGWYEDSKATNVGSVEKALASFDNITLIAGGKDKGGSYAPLADLIRQRVRHLILIGEAKERMAAELGALTDTLMAATLADAVNQAAALTAAGGTVLFSPACSSFDMFRDYEDRAEQFKALVRGLPAWEAQ